jgi:hypothetical protein
MKFICLLVIMASLSGFSQTKLSESLITIQTNKKNLENHLIEIYAYNFINHVYSSKDLLITINSKKNGKDYLRIDQSSNILYKQRYLISENGPIIDLKEKKILFDGFAKLVKCSQDSVIFFINDLFSGPYYSFYNLKTNNYSDITTKDFKPQVGETIEFDQQKSPYKLYITPKGKEKQLLLEDAGKAISNSVLKKAEIPIYWMDKETFIFPQMKISDMEGQITKVHWPSKTAKSIGTFNSLAKMDVTFSFTKSLNNFVEFNFKDKYFLINPGKESMLMLFYKDFDNNFSVATEAKPLRAIFYKGVEIGKGNFNIKNFVVSENYAAYLLNSNFGSAENKCQLSVYSIFKNKWEIINTENINSIVGWVKQ